MSKLLTFHHSSFNLQHEMASKSFSEQPSSTFKSKYNAFIKSTTGKTGKAIPSPFRFSTSNQLWNKLEKINGFDMDKPTDYSSSDLLTRYNPVNVVLEDKTSVSLWLKKCHVFSCLLPGFTSAKLNYCVYFKRFGGDSLKVNKILKWKDLEAGNQQMYDGYFWSTFPTPIQFNRQFMIILASSLYSSMAKPDLCLAVNVLFLVILINWKITWGIMKSSSGLVVKYLLSSIYFDFSFYVTFFVIFCWFYTYSEKYHIYFYIYIFILFFHHFYIHRLSLCDV